MPEMQPEQKMTSLLRMIRSWSLHWNLEEMFKEVITHSVSILNADFGYLLLLEKDGLKVKSSSVKSNQELKPYKQEIAEKVIRHGQAIYASSILRSQNEESQIYCVPMTANKGVLGVIYIEFINKIDEIKQEEKLIFEMLGLQVASFFENAVLYLSAITDPLTGLFSHRHFQQECDLLIHHSTRNNTPLSLLIIDLDHFKDLNDKFGHEEGNICLKRISQILQENLRSTDIIARFGGDEFEVLLPNVTVEKSLQIAESLRLQIQKEPFPLQISATIGVAHYPLHATDYQTLFLAADQALYDGKNKGRNVVVLSTKTSEQQQLKQESLKTRFDKLNNDSKKPIKKFSDSIKKETQRFDGLDIIQRLNSSSNGEVLLAKQLELDRFVALKRPLTSHLTQEQANAFKKEAFITASLNHPGVAPLYTMGKSIDGRLYYTMKPIEGDSLSDILMRWKNKEAQTIKNYGLLKLLHILLKTSETIAYAHNRGIAHLDIHPGNIIEGEYGEYTLIDWGKGKKLSEIQEPSKNEGIYISGSPIYRPPEQITQNIEGKFTDIYSLGIILFEILTNSTPFKKDTNKETIEAIKNGLDFSDSKNTLRYTVEPILWDLCKNSISKDYLQRISANDFVKVLKRYVLSETDTKTHHFQNTTTPMKQEEWFTNLEGNVWELKDGTWSTKGNYGAHQLFWKQLVTGNFIFTAEGWVTEYPREISIFCLGKAIKNKTGWNIQKNRYQGYYFQIGADNNMITKLARHDEDILVSNIKIELNKKYQITISYQNSLLLCFLNNELVFNYREFRPFNGYHIGFYSYGSGSHFKPIEIKYQTSSLFIPTIRIADENLIYGQYEEAIKKYEELIMIYPDRQEGREALLKKGYSLLKLNKEKEALEIFAKLENTALEPYAILESALIELPSNEYELTHKQGDYQKATEIIEKIATKFPKHPALLRILHNCFLMQDPNFGNFANFKKDREISTFSRLKLLMVGFHTLSLPNHSQWLCFQGALKHLALLGNWEEVKSLFLTNIEPYKYYLNFKIGFNEEVLTLYYMYDKLSDFKNIFPNSLKIVSFTRLYPSIIIEEFPHAFDNEHYHNSKLTINSVQPIQLYIVYELCSHKTYDFLNTYTHLAESQSIYLLLMKNWRERDYLEFEMLIANNPNNLENINILLEQFSKASNEHKEEAYILKAYFAACNALFHFDLDSCIDYLNQSNNLTTKIQPLQEKRLVLTACLHNLGYNSELGKEELLFLNKIYLAGPRLELADDLLNKDLAFLSKKWPIKPTHLYFDVIVYATWAYWKKEYQIAVKHCNQLINPKFGSAYFQKYLLNLKNKIEESSQNEI